MYVYNITIWEGHTQVYIAKGITRQRIIDICKVEKTTGRRLMVYDPLTAAYISDVLIAKFLQVDNVIAKLIFDEGATVLEKLDGMRVYKLRLGNQILKATDANFEVVRTITERDERRYSPVKYLRYGK